MIIIYEILSFTVLIFSPIILLTRIIINKEHKTRFIEKLSIISGLKKSDKIIWFHCCSVGELRSIIPLVKKLEDKYKKKQILITTSTLSSSQIFNQEKFGKTIHQFFPIDNFFLNRKFLDFWKPDIAIFVESEIWPSMFYILKKKRIPLILLNARITNKSFNKWKKIKIFSKNIFSKIDLALPQNNETKNYLNNLGVKNIKFLGNLKYSSIDNKKIKLEDNNFLKNLKNKLLLCAASTHRGEDEIFIKSHIYLKKKYKKLLTIIIPRHIKRSNEIIEIVKKYNLKFELYSEKKNLKTNPDIYLVDAYGQNEKFYSLSSTVFMGGSFIKHGGQNPLEPARLGCNVLNGPHVDNFKEVYSLMNKLNISTTVKSQSHLKKLLTQKLKKSKKNLNYIKIKKIGSKILYNNINELDNFLNNENKKTSILG